MHNDVMLPKRSIDLVISIVCTLLDVCGNVRTVTKYQMKLLRCMYSLSRAICVRFSVIFSMRSEFDKYVFASSVRAIWGEHDEC